MTDVKSRDVNVMDNITSILERVEHASSPKRVSPFTGTRSDVVRAILLSVHSQYGNNKKEEPKKEEPKKNEKNQIFFDVDKLDKMSSEELELLLDSTVWPQTFAKVATQLVDCVAALGTHTGKVPDARLGPAIVMSMSSSLMPIDPALGACTSTVRTAHLLSAAGNGAYNKLYRILCTSISVDGEPVTQLANVFASQDETFQEIQSLMTHQGKEVLEALSCACEERLSLDSGHMPEQVEGRRPQVLYPLEDGTYLAVTPLYSCSMGSELSARIFARTFREKGKPKPFLVNERTTRAGGTKPQNAGLLANDLGGRFPRLMCQPPTSTSRTADALVTKFRRGGLSPGAGSIRRENFDEFLNACLAHPIRNNVASRDRMHAAIESVIEDAMLPMREIASENDASHARHGRPLASLSDLPSGSHLLATLLGMDEAEDDRDELLQAVEDAAEEIGRTSAAGLRARLRKMRDTPPLVIGDEMTRFLTNVAKRKVEEFVR